MAAAAHYGRDLARIHDEGFGSFARAAASGLLPLLRPPGTAVELGCGAGNGAEVLARAGFHVVGWDISAAMVARARARVPSGEFHAGSFLEAELPPCDVVTALGEVLSYAADPRVGRRTLGALFRRVRRALRPGGLFALDVVTRGRGTPPRTRVVERPGWMVVSRVSEARGLLERQVTTFVREGGAWRRSDEVHHQHAWEPDVVEELLRGAGFRVRRIRSLGGERFARGQAAFLARPAR